jgi:membrane-associated protease RseP (regulator of RpoE activity)
MNGSLTKERRNKMILSVILGIVCVIYVLPVLAVLINSFKLNTFVKTNAFALPTGEMWAGMDNFIKGMTFGNYPFWNSVKYSVVITILSTALILIGTSMAAWYIARVNSVFCKALYFLCVFSMVVPFQMVMFTLSNTADKLKLNTPWTIPVVYLGFGAGLAIFMFVGFVKSIPLEIEEATWGLKLKYTWYNAIDFVRIVWYSLKMLVTGSAGVEDLSGPVGIVSTINEVGVQSISIRAALENIAYFGSMIAVNLAVMNLLPIPALDGGHILFLTISTLSEKLLKRKLPVKYEAAVNMVFFALLMGLMLFVTFNDVHKIIAQQMGG